MAALSQGGGIKSKLHEEGSRQYVAGYMRIWVEAQFNDNLEQNISRQKRPGTHFKFAMN